MPHRVLLDVYVPLAVADALRRRGIDVSTAQEEGLSLSDDESLLEQSSAQERVLVTQDADFLEIVPRWRRGPDLVAGTFSPFPAHDQTSPNISACSRSIHPKSNGAIRRDGCATR